MWHPANPDYWRKIHSMPMCFDPITAITAVAAVVSTVATISQASAASKADKYNAAVATQNSQVATDQADMSLQTQQTDAYRKLGSIKAAYGASGVTTDGSPMDVLADSFTQSELDANTIIYNGKVKAAGYTDTANLDSAAASNATKAGYLNAASTALTGGAKTAQSYNDVGTNNQLPWQAPGYVNP